MAAGAYAPDRADIIWIHHDPQKGIEMKGMHPMLVLSPKTFNERTGIVIGFPMTHAQTNDENPFAVNIEGPKSEAAYILCHQPKSFDWRERGAKPHPWKQAPARIVRRALDELDLILAVSGS